MTDFVPESTEELARIVASAAADREPLEILGNGTKRTMGRPVAARHTLSTSSLRGVTLYEPEELVLTARAGTPLSEIEALLAEHNQQLAFEPPHWGEQTIGGIVATGLSGPRRIQAGAVRDHLLGFGAVNGRGEIFKSGGRVVKNVTGYDHSKLMTGSFGTLAVLSEVTLKVLPRPEARATLVLKGKTARQVTALFREALAMPLDITGAAWVPSFSGESVAALRLEGFADSVADRAASLQRSFGVSIAGSEFDDFWTQIRDVAFLESAPCLWRVSVPPGSGADLLEAMNTPNAFLDWGGGLAWLEAPNENPQAEKLRALTARSGGHATLLRAGVEFRGTLDVFQPQPAALASLTGRVKDSFDPLRILNPGRMYAGI
jgi:glycolate oxidase FAD binding subunit